MKLEINTKTPQKQYKNMETEQYTIECWIGDRRNHEKFKNF